MKKLLTLLVLSLIAILSAMGLAACDLDSGNDSGKEEPPITVHTHVYDEGVTTIEPTCTEKGEITFTCIDGDYSYTEEIAALGHTPLEAKEENRVTPTCTGKGSYNSVVYCAVCGEELSRETVEIEATGHTPLEAKEENRVTPTCTEKGSYDSVVYCTVCGEELSRETIGTEATGHTPLEAKEENRVTSTCTGKGSYDSVVYCAVCGEELSRESKELSALGHNYDAEIIESTCTEQGYTTYTCSRCGDSYIGEYTAPLGHDYEWTVTKEPTENEEGIEAGVCSRCRDTITRDIPKLNHEHNYEETVIAPTCTENGYTLYQCSCGDSYTDNETNALGHNYTESITAPTCIAQGYTTYTCSRCGDSYADNYVAVIEHNYVDGVCSVCGESEPVSQDGLAELKTKVTALKGQSDTVYEEVINFSYILNDLSSFINVLNNNSYYLSDLFGYDLQQEIEEIYTAVNENIESFNAFGTGFLALQSNVNSLYEIVFSEEYGDINTLLADFEALSQQIAYAIATLNEYSSLLGQAQAVAAEFLSNENIENVIATFNSVYLENADNIAEVQAIVTDIFMRIEEAYEHAPWDYKYEWEELREYAQTIRDKTMFYSECCYGLENVVEQLEEYLFSGEYVLSDILNLVSAGIDDVSFIISNQYIIQDMWARIEELNAMYNELLMQSGGDIDNYALQILDEMQWRIDYLIALSIEAEDSGDWSYVENHVYQLYDLFRQLDDNLSYSLDSWYEYYDSLYYGIYEIVFSIEYRDVVLLQDNLMGLIVVIEDLKNVLREQDGSTEQILDEMQWRIDNLIAFSIDAEEGGDWSYLENYDFYELYDLFWQLDELLCNYNTWGEYYREEMSYIFEFERYIQEKDYDVLFDNLDIVSNAIWDIRYRLEEFGELPESFLLYDFSQEEGGYIVTETYNKAITQLEIPDYYEGYPVIGIESWAFGDCERLVSVTIGNNVISIGDSAFQNCSSLTSVTIGNNVTSIGEFAFCDCISLAEITIPESVTTIGYYAFGECNSLTGINVDSDNEYYKSIDGNLYSYDGTTLIQYAIGKTNTEFTIPETVISIGDYAFAFCNSLTEIIIPDSVTSIGSGAFSWCSIEYAKIPAIAISYIPKENLKTVEITSGESIGNSAFSYCSSLTEIIIPDSVTSIGNRAFYNCSSLTSVNYTGTIDSWCEISFSDVYSNPIYYAHNLYINNVPITEVVLENITEIKPYAFYGCSSLTEITISDSVTSIGNSAFYNCSIEYAKIPAIAISYIPKENLKTVEITSGESIGNSVFSYCSSLTEIIIPDSVTSIGNRAFFDCTSLTSITIPDSVTSVGYDAFYNCSSLENVIIGGSVTSIGESAFYGCSSLTEITISDSVTSIGSSAFSWCSIEYAKIPAIAISYIIPKGNLKTVEITSGESIGNYAFSDCSSLTEIIIPDSVTSIGDYAFYNCSSLEKVIIGDSVTSIGYRVFENCSSLTEIIIPDSVTSIGDYAFYNCSSLEKVIIGDSVTSIGYRVFENCSSLTGITISDSVTSIGESAFYNCSSLEKVTIGNGVTSIKGNSFKDCSSLTSIYYKGTASQWAQIDGLDYILLYYIKISSTSVHLSSRTLYINNAPVTEVVLEDITEIEPYAFYGCSSLTEITISDSVTSIGDGAFDNCSIEYAKIPAIAISYIPKENLKTVEITSGESIGDYAFSNCSSLTEITISDSVTSIGDVAFFNCGSLTSVTIPDSVTSVGYDAFSYCSGLQYNEYDNGLYLGNENNPYVILVKAKSEDITSCTINENTKIIYDDAFSGCRSLTEISVNSNNKNYKSIDGNLYSYDGTVLIQYAIGKTVTEFTIPDSVTSIGDNAFYNCSNLTEITIPDSVTSIGKRAFSYCWRLMEITIPDSVTGIGNSAFSTCHSLTSITIPEAVISIGEWAFEDCNKLTEVTIGNSVTSIEARAFWGCTSLTSITFNGTIEEWSAISKGSSWIYDVPATVVRCTDGDVAI